VGPMSESGEDGDGCERAEMGRLKEADPVPENQERERDGREGTGKGRRGGEGLIGGKKGRRAGRQDGRCPRADDDEER